MKNSNRAGEFRASQRFKELLAATVAKSHRSQANLREMLLYSYGGQQSITLSTKFSSKKK